MSEVVLRKKDERYEIHDLHLGDLTLSVTYLNAGQNTIGHLHSQEEGYYIASGLGRMMVNDRITQVSGGQFMVVPPNTYHRIFNDGLLSLVFICAWEK